MSTNARQDFHLAAFTNLNVFIKIVTELSEQPDLVRAYETAPDILTNGRTINQMVLDDLMVAYASIMRDVADQDIPLSYYKQLLSAYDGKMISDAEAREALQAALLRQREAGAADINAPEFMLLFNDSVPTLVFQNIINNWVNVVDMFGQLMFTTDAINTSQKTADLLNHVAVLQNELLTTTQKRDDAVATVVKSPQANDNAPTAPEKSSAPSNGMVIHYPEDIGEVDEVMDQLIGLQEAKNQVKEIRARVKYKRALMEAGLYQHEKPSMDHYIFRGPPGTGKTTFGRFIGKIYEEAGLLDLGHVVECSRVTLVGGYIGQTAIKTQKVVEEALGGVLFVDEAYSLFGTGNDFGKEALEVILRAMEVYKGQMIVVFAGYPDKMDELIRSNPGLTRRFKHTVNFKDFQMNELMEIFDRSLAAKQLTITKEARDHVQRSIQTLKQIKGNDFGNAGTIENIVEILQDKLALASEANGTLDKIATLVAAGLDIPKGLKTKLVQITLAEAQQFKPENEVIHTSEGIGFSSSLAPPKLHR